MNHPESDSKDAFFKQLASISDAMSAAHGQDFAMGALVLAARFIAERTPRPGPQTTTGQTAPTAPAQPAQPGQPASPGA